MFQRREFLGSVAALGAAALLPGRVSAQGKPHRIDVHHHLMYPGFLDDVAGRRAGSNFKWSPQMSLEDMDKSGIALSVMSLIQPSAATTDVEKGRRIARASNDYGAQLVRDHKGRFASFATLPLLDTDGSLKEIAYSLDTLKAEGIALWTVYSGKYLGDPAFVPVFEELNRRKAVVYTHPTVPDCCNNLIKGVPVSTLEYNHDTTRTIASLVFGEAKTALRFPDIKFIWSHSGGTLPYLTSRFEELAGRRKSEFPDGAVPVFRKFYYEVAQGNTPGMLAALMHMVPISQVLFGSDFPYREAKEAVDGVANYKPFSDADRLAIDRGNTIRIMPQLKSG